MPHTLYIKNMVCARCQRVVYEEIRNIGLHPLSVNLGEVVLSEDDLSTEQNALLNNALLSSGFERLSDRKGRLIETIKNKVIETIRLTGQPLHINWSDWLSETFMVEYNYLSSLFSSSEGITLEQFIIRQKIERVKELLFYDELNLSEIANLLGYSSVAHLSSQFKKVTGLTPSALKKLKGKQNLRINLDLVSGAQKGTL